uniref:Predicted protein n=1 Tax=Hordeum vulgare subsp. vulgare TaxID=112509 RepID=F2EFF4_HORVV|nr:predicted protein [Hordeum vulgare subsp. vulgare]
MHDAVEWLVGGGASASCIPHAAHRLRSSHLGRWHADGCLTGSGLGGWPAARI